MKHAPLALSDTPYSSRRVAVRHNGAGWVMSSTAGEASGHFPTKAAAVAAAKQALERHGGVMTVHQANGAVRETLTLGRDVAVRLNGIEGVALNAASRRLLREVQASGMSPAQQRSAISAAFKK